MKNQDAQNAYAYAHAEAMKLLEQLIERVENMDAPDESTNWVNVGDLGRLVIALNEIANPEV